LRLLKFAEIRIQLPELEVAPGKCLTFAAIPNRQDRLAGQRRPLRSGQAPDHAITYYGDRSPALFPIPAEGKHHPECTAHPDHLPKRESPRVVGRVISHLKPRHREAPWTACC